MYDMSRIGTPVQVTNWQFQSKVFVGLGPLTSQNICSTTKAECCSNLVVLNLDSVEMQCSHVVTLSSVPWCFWVQHPNNSTKQQRASGWKWLIDRTGPGRPTQIEQGNRTLDSYKWQCIVQHYSAVRQPMKERTIAHWPRCNDLDKLRCDKIGYTFGDPWGVMWDHAGLLALFCCLNHWR